MGWLITAAVLLFLWFLPLGIDGVYNSDGARAWLVISPVRVALYPGKKKRKKEKTADMPAKKETRENSKQESKNCGSLSDFLPIMQIVIDLLGDLRRRFRVKRLEFKLILAGDDPCDLGINYGRAWAALGNLMPRLEQLFVIKKRNLEVECDFTANETLVFARVYMTITFGRLLSILVYYGIRALKQYFKVLNQRKGGAET